MKNPPTTTDFPKAGDDEADVVNVSGHPGTTPPVPRPRTMDTTAPGYAGHRAQIEIDAQSGEQFGAATAARAQRVWADAVEHLSGPHTRGYLRNVFGLDDADGR